MALMYEDRPEVILRRLVLVCIIITAGISAIAIIGWMLNWLILAGISTDYIPMALSTALLFILLSGALLVYLRQPASPHISMIARVSVFLVILISFIILIDFFTGMTFDIEGLLISRPEQFEGVPIGRMSPITAANFLLAGSALLLLLTPPAAGRQRARGAAAFLATIVISVGFVVLLGYLYGTPLLYGGNIIPVALTTAIVFVFLGIGIIFAAGEHYWPLSSIMGSSVSARLLRIFLPATIALVLTWSFLDIVIFQHVGNHVLVSSVVAILAVIMLGIIIPKISHVIGSDIDRADSERRRAQEALKESQDRLDLALESGQMGVWDMDLIHDTMWRSLRHDQIFGYESLLPEWSYAIFLQHVVHEDRDLIRHYFDEALRTGKLVFECQIIWPDQSRHWIFVKGQTYSDEKARPVRMLGTVMDITQRKQAEKALIKEKEFTEIALDSQHDTFFVFDPSTNKAIRWNKSFKDITGYTDEEIASLKAPNSYYSQQDMEKAASYMESLMHNEKGRVELTLICKDGHKILFEYEASFIRDESGELNYIISIGRDITERKQSEETLRESESRLNKSQGIAHVGSWVLDVSTNRLTWSDEVYRIFGLKPAEFTPTYEAFLDVIHPEDRVMVDEAYSRSLRESRDIYDIEHRIVRRLTGEIRHLHERCEHIKDASGAIIRSVGIVQDITERKMAEEELRKHRDHLEELVQKRTNELSISREKEHAAALYARSLIETSLDPVVTISKDGTIMDANKATELVTGISRDQLIGSDFSVYFTEPKKAREGYKRVFERGFLTDYPLAIRHKSGKVTDVLYNAAVYRNEAGEIGGIFATARDVTERKRALEMLRMDERRLRSTLKISQYRSTTLHNLLNMALEEVVSFSDSKVGYIYYYNEEKEEFTLNAWSKNVMESCKIQDPQTTYQLRLTGIWGEAVRQRKPVIINDFQAPDPLKKGYPEGHTPLLRFMTLPVFSNERIIAVVGVGNKETDYTDIDTAQLKQMMDSVWLIAQRQEAEESMKYAKEEAERANMAKTNFLHTMSHELRTPLNAVIGFSLILKQKTVGELNEKQERFIDNIITGGNNLLNIISQILDVVKMYEGTLELRIENIPVPETLDEIIGIIKEKALKKNVLIEKDLDPELEYIEADKQKFKQVFINLLENAVKFSKDEGGTVSINAKKEGDMARFSVSDRGIGIKEEDIEKIFRKFTQLDSGTTRKYGGTGIGLAITKQFVELHGGKIYGESKYGIGSTFTFLIPLKSKNGEI